MADIYDKGTPDQYQLNALYGAPMENALRGSQSGPKEESTSAMIERLLQLYGGAGLAGGGGGAGYAVGGPVGGVAGATPGMATMMNAGDPNIQDVWLHQMVQAIRRRARGLE